MGFPLSRSLYPFIRNKSSGLMFFLDFSMYYRYILYIETKELQMNRIPFVIFALFAVIPAQAQTVDVLGKPYERGCVQEALRDSCRPTGSAFASDLVRVPGVGSRVGECAVGEIAHCTVMDTGVTAAPAPIPAAKAPTAPSHRGPGGGRGGRR